MGRWMRIGSGRLTRAYRPPFHPGTGLLRGGSTRHDPDHRSKSLSCRGHRRGYAKVGSGPVSPDHAGKRRRGKTWTPAKKGGRDACHPGRRMSSPRNSPGRCPVILQSSCRGSHRSRSRHRGRIQQTVSRDMSSFACMRHARKYAPLERRQCCRENANPTPESAVSCRQIRVGPDQHPRVRFHP